MLRVVIRQNRRGHNRPFIPDQCVFLQRHNRYGLHDLIEVKVNRYYILTYIVGMGWEGDEFVINVL